VEPRRAGRAELEEEALVRQPLRDEDDRVALDLKRVAERRLAAHAARVDGRDGALGAHADPEVVQVLAEERALERLVAERRDLLARRDELDRVALAGQELGHARAHEVALAVVDDDASVRQGL
jgi:hypothetical protein